MRPTPRAAPTLLVGACALSGAAALVYQVLWTRQLALLLGHTVAAVTTVLATFMAGLALGSAVAARGVECLRAEFRPRTYALVELGIAGAAIAFPVLLRADLPRPGLVVALLVPTTLMGATLPL